MNGEAVRDWLTENTGLEPALLQGPAFGHLVQERMKRTGAPDEAAYLRRLRGSAGEVEKLIEGVAVRETWFFRYPQSFELLATHLQSLRRSRDTRDGVRMLSVGCSTGEEACSMAITALQSGWPAAEITLDAVDVNGASLAQARRGAYRLHAVRNQPPDWAFGWLTIAPEHVRVAPEAAGAIAYRQSDVLKSPEQELAGRYDAIFCRNLLIYLNAAAREKLVTRLATWLAGDGLLFVGHAEPLSAFAGLFEPVHSPHAFAFRRATPKAQPPVTGGIPSSRPSASHPNRRGARFPAVPVRANLGAGSPQPAELRTLAEARALADRGELNEARIVAEAVLAADGPSPEALELLGSVQLAMGRVDAARECFRKVVYLWPDHEEALLQLALIADDLGEPQQAEQYRRRSERAHRHGAAAREVKRG